MGLIKPRTAPAAAATPAPVPKPDQKKVYGEQQPLHIKWRPQQLEDVVGQDGVVKNLTQLFDSKRVPHAYLFTGPSGCGKTTIARIIAAKVGAELIEVDAARYSTIESMRALLDGSKYQSLSSSAKKFYLIDECHAISKAGWQTLLKTTEEPAHHLYWGFCTTEAEKIPATVRTRCHAYDLKPVPWEMLAAYLEHVVTEEQLNITPEFIGMAARQAQGSVRQALVFISMLDGIVDKAEALRLVEDVDAQTEGPIVLARMLCTGKGASWTAARAVLVDLADTSPETIRLVVLAYASSMALKADEKNAERLLAVIQAFSQPCNMSEKMAPIILATATLLLG